MQDREKEIARAAIAVFARYGVKRATMSDIATEAKVSRQTLYNFFPNKDAMLRGAMRCFILTQWDLTEAEWAQSDAIEDQLDGLFKNFVITPWQMIRALPDFEEMETGYNDAGHDELMRLNDVSAARLAALLARFESALAQKGLSADALARLLLSAMMGIKKNTQTEVELIAQLQTLRATICALLSVKQGA